VSFLGSGMQLGFAGMHPIVTDLYK